MSTVTQLPIVGFVDSQTGTRLVERWTDSAYGVYGDHARGDAYVSLYENANTRCEVALYPILCDDGSYGVEECATSWIVRLMAGDGDAYDLGRDTAEIDYEWGSALAYDDETQAQDAAQRLGSQDWSFAVLGPLTEAMAG